MDDRLFEKIHRINYLAAEVNALYHQAAVRLGMPDSVMCVLYAICDSGGSCLLGEIYRQSGISKQTVNSAIRRLERDGILFLRQSKGRCKTVFLTDEGRQYVNRMILPLCRAETGAIESWTDGEIDAYIALTEKYAAAFQSQIENL